MMTTGSPAISWVPPGHYYSPIPSDADIERHRQRLRLDPPVAIHGIDLHDDEQVALLERLATFYRSLPFSADRQPAVRYYFDNDQYSYADAIFLYSMLRHVRPQRIIEVGSGYSTAVMLDTIERFFDQPPRLLCIEPHPERLLSLIATDDLRRLELLQVGVESVGLDPFKALQAGDILFIDSTHVAKLGGDVNRLMFEILPVLAPGVVVHFHDIFFPFEYPLAWIEENRAWNEAYLLRAFLSYNRAFEIMLFNHYVALTHEGLLRRDFPLCLRNPGGSLWLRRA
jgi:predicted O-methyltransferase YrrM